ncbi:MAG TPA: hypothetical protein VHB79_29710 [Polyangiaceae bacterium]|nr:hypothetical protein [Polyangiaceae bacterium]
MNDERVLRQVTASEVTRRLLESAERDAPATGAVQRALAGLGVAPTVAAVVSVTAGTKSAAAAPAGGALLKASGGAAAFSTAAKWVAVGLVSGVALMKTVDLVRRPSSGPGVAQPARATSTRPLASSSGSAQPSFAPVLAPSAERAPPHASGTIPTPARQDGSLTSALEASSPARPSAEPTLPSAGAFETSAARASNLAQLAALAKARQSLAVHQPAVALGLLDEFARRFPSSQLEEEAAVLRVDALRALGRSVRAEELADRFLREHPTSVYAARVRGAATIP